MLSLYEKLGGPTTVEAAVDLFYDKLLADPKVSHFFKNVEMAGQRSKQKLFLTVLLGGMLHYSGKNLREVHKHLPLKHEHFHAVMDHLKATLQELHVSQDLIERVMILVGSTHDDVLNL